ncbi:MAG: hypothetical protein ACXVXG_07500 [Nocardioidaceae bacterium]
MGSAAGRSGVRRCRRPVLAVRDGARATGPVVGLLAVLAVHPTVLPAANREVSPDLPGAVRRALAGHVRWSVVATGAAGDMSTRASRRAQTPAEVDRLGTEAAGQLRALLDTSPAAAADPALGVEAARGVLPLAPVPAATREARAAAVVAARATLAAAPDDAVLLGYAGGYCGYLPTADAYGRDDYEVLVSRVAPGESERAVSGAAHLHDG